MVLSKTDLFGCFLPVVGCSPVGAGASEHLVVPGCPVHHDVLPFGGWDLAEEEVDPSPQDRSGGGRGARGGSGAETAAQANRP